MRSRQTALADVEVRCEPPTTSAVSCDKTVPGAVPLHISQTLNACAAQTRRRSVPLPDAQTICGSDQTGDNLKEEQDARTFAHALSQEQEESLEGVRCVTPLADENVLISAFRLTYRVHQSFNQMAAASCVAACVIGTAATRRLFLCLLCGSLSALAVRAHTHGMDDQQRARRLCGWVNCALGHILWCIYHSGTNANDVNVHTLTSFVGMAYLCSVGCAGVLVTTWPQRVFMGISAVAHHAYAHSHVPDAAKLMSKHEMTALTTLIVAGCLTMAGVIEGPLIAISAKAEAREKAARKQAEELDRQVATLEMVRREALLERVVGRKLQRTVAQRKLRRGFMATTEEPHALTWE